jgi:2-iminobutanoate/2-iminopropanoate deaminase
VVHNDVVYVAGQLPIDPATGLRELGDVEAQARQVLANLRAVLDAAGSSLQQVLRTTVYVRDITLWDRVNEVYSQIFGDHFPARTVVPTGPLHHGFLVEIDAIAVARTPLP